MQELHVSLLAAVRGSYQFMNFYFEFLYYHAPVCHVESIPITRVLVLDCFHNSFALFIALPVSLSPIFANFSI